MHVQHVPLDCFRRSDAGNESIQTIMILSVAALVLAAAMKLGGVVRQGTEQKIGAMFVSAADSAAPDRLPDLRTLAGRNSNLRAMKTSTATPSVPAISKSPATKEFTQPPGKTLRLSKATAVSAEFLGPMVDPVRQPNSNPAISDPIDTAPTAPPSKPIVVQPIGGPEPQPESPAVNKPTAKPEKNTGPSSDPKDDDETEDEEDESSSGEESDVKRRIAKKRDDETFDDSADSGSGGEVSQATGTGPVPAS